MGVESYLEYYKALGMICLYLCIFFRVMSVGIPWLFARRSDQDEVNK